MLESSPGWLVRQKEEKERSPEAGESLLQKGSLTRAANLSMLQNRKGEKGEKNNRCDESQKEFELSEICDGETLKCCFFKIYLF